MKAAMLQETGLVTIVQVADLAPGPTDLLIEVAFAGVCGSDLHSFKGTHPFRHAPVVLGHELSGTVAAMGDQVTGWELGEAVTVMPYVHCGHCPACLKGQTNVCENKVVPGIKGWVGTMATHFLAPAAVTFRLGANTDLKLGALVEPFAVGVHSAHRARVDAGSKVLVLGGGTIGLVTAAAALKLGAASVAVADLYDFNLRVAAKLGVAHTYNARIEHFEDVVRADYPQGFEAIFLTSGATVNVGQAVRLAQRGGRIVVTAIYGESVPVSLSELTQRELELLGTQIYTADDYCLTLDWLDAGDLPMGELITHVMPLEQAQNALLTMRDRTEDSIKILLTP